MNQSIELSFDRGTLLLRGVRSRETWTRVASPAEFDSDLESSLAKKWGERRDGWRLFRDAGILHEGQTTFVPDFLFRHDDGREVLLEIVGFWTPQYLAAKRQTLQRFGQHRILLAIPQRNLRADVAVGPNVIVYKTALKVEPVLAALNQSHAITSMSLSRSSSSPAVSVSVPPPP